MVRPPRPATPRHTTPRPSQGARAWVGRGRGAETIAASFVPPLNGSAVRLFNLALDVPAASLAEAGRPLATGVRAPIPARRTHRLAPAREGSGGC
eukprot:SAG11_NODE_6609_length_1279_cov_2.388136_2_plen_94_part_01